MNDEKFYKEYSRFHLSQKNKPMNPNNENIISRLNYLKKQIEKECISYGEIAELQELAQYIPEHETILREWAGLPE